MAKKSIFNDLSASAKEQCNAMFTKNEAKVKNYEQLGLLEGLTHTEKVHMATILDNQFNRIVQEYGGMLSESTSVTNSGGANFNAGTGEQWAGVVLPMVRKVFADTISAKEFVSIQPLQMPTGLVFYLDFKYGTTKAPFTEGESVYGTTNVFNTDPVGGLYGDGRFAYSINTVSASVSTTVTSGSFQDVLFDNALSGSVIANEIKKIAVPVSALTGYDANMLMAFTISGSGVTPATQLPAFTTFDGTNIYFIVSGSSANVASATRVVSYSLATRDNFRGDYEDRTGTLAIADYNIEFASATINAKTRKLKASWTQEIVTDVKAYQGIDVESEITSLMAEEVGKEIDLEVLALLLDSVTKGGTRDFWSYQNNTEINANKTGFVPMNSGYYNSQQQWFETLGTKINLVSNKIYKKSLRGQANFAVVSPEVANILESMAGYASDADVSKMNSSYGAKAQGTYKSQYKVFKNPYFDTNRILMGLKGNTYLECGAVLAPYVPLEVTPLIYNPVTGTPAKIMNTRYGTKVLRSEFYGDVIVGGLPS
jgi:hypothetical protein